MKSVSFFACFCLGLFFLSNCSKHKSAFKALNLEEVTIDELQKEYQSGKLTAVEVVRAYIERIEATDQNGKKLNSILQLNPDAISIAKQLDKERKEGKVRSPLHGIPVVLKDNIDTFDKMNTTAGAIALKDSKPLKDAFIVTKLRESGAIILGKSNLSEWANFHSNVSSSGWSALGGQTKNPYDITRNPCGSSAGSGVAVSANFTVFAIGTETNGSIVCPANANGIVGIKPTVGLLSRSGIIPISFTQDTPGPMARTVRDAAIALGIMVGTDESDSKTIDSEGHFHTDYTQFLKVDGLKGKRLGFYRAPMGGYFKLDSMMYKTVEFLKSQGAEIVEIDKISPVNVGGDSFQVLLYEFKAGLNDYFNSLGENAPVKSLEELIKLTQLDKVEMQFDHDLLNQAQAKGDLNSKEYKDALAKMLVNMRDNGIDKVMADNKLDGFVSVTGGPAWKTDPILGDNFLTSSSSPAAIAGYPNISVPMGFIDGLPVGISFFGKAWSEPILLEMAYSYEQASKIRKAPILD